MEPTGIYRHGQYALDPWTFARECLGFHPDPHQARVLDPTVRRGILNCCRQWGKSTVTAVKAVHRLLHNPESLTIVAAPCERQSAELVRKCERFLRALSIRPRGDGDNEISILLPNGARIVGLPGEESTVRCFSGVSLLLIDEASRVPDELYLALRPKTATVAEAAIWLMSTPNGRQGFFYREWHAPDRDWMRIAVPATECPRIPAAFLEDERKAHTESSFRQEYLCDFLASDTAFFDPQAVDAAFDKTVPALFVQPGPANHPSRFFLGLDLGQMQDHSAIAIVERRTVPTGFDHANWVPITEDRLFINHLERPPLRTPYPAVIDRAKDLASHPLLERRVTLAVDATGVGKPVCDMLAESRLNATLMPILITAGDHAHRSKGVWHVPRRELLSNLQILLHRRGIAISADFPESEVLRGELQAFSLANANAAPHDDLLFATALAAWASARQEQPIDGVNPFPGIHADLHDLYSKTGR